MFETLDPRKRRVISSLGYTALVALVTGLGYLTFQVTSERHRRSEAATEAATEPDTLPLVELEAFSVREEKSSDARRLNVSVRIHLNAPGSIDCYLFVVAHNDHVSPKQWSVWPTQGPDGALTAGGHFRSNVPAAGLPLTLSSSWQRITASLDHPLGQAPFDLVMIYVVSPKGEIILARPFPC